MNTMSSENTDVGSLSKRLSEVFYDQALGDVSVSVPKNDKNLPSASYHLEGKPKYGDCYIFDYQEFENDHREKLYRPGSEKDVERLKYDFMKLNFNVYADFLNLTAQATLDVLKEAAKKDYKESKCFVCCFLTHGENGSLLMHDDTVKIDEILKIFSRSACESLAGKPKVFIFQACRGKSFEKGVSCDSTDSGSEMDISDDGIPDYLDFLLVYATYEEKVSFKTKDKEHKEHNHGSYFIDELCRSLEQFSDQLDLLQILTIVNYRVAHFFLSSSKETEANNKKQMPSFTSRLTSKVQFNEKIPSMFVSDDTKFFDKRRQRFSLGLQSTKHPLEDMKTYKIQNSKGIHFLCLENQLGGQFNNCFTSLWDSIATRGYKRLQLKDWSENDLKDCLKKVAAQHCENTDCLICFVACQMKGDYLYDKKGKKFLKQLVVEQFTGETCSKLRGKPKIFIFLMSKKTPSKKALFPCISAESTDGDSLIPVHSDLLKVAITVQEPRQLDGVLAKLCNIFGQKSSEDFLSQLTRMNDELVKDYGFYSLTDNHSATFCFDSTLTETLILNKPKIKST